MSHDIAVEDLVSQAVHREAMRLIEGDMRLRNQVMAELRSWSASGSTMAAHAADWMQVIERSAWAEVLAATTRGAQLRLQSPLPAVLPILLRTAIAAAVRRGDARTIEELDLAELQRAKAAAALEALRAIGVVAEVFGSLVWGRWDPERSDVDILVLTESDATYGMYSAVGDIVSRFVGPSHDVVYLDQLRAPSRAYLLQQRREHGAPEVISPRRPE